MSESFEVEVKVTFRMRVPHERAAEVLKDIMNEGRVNTVGTPPIMQAAGEAAEGVIVDLINQRWPKGASPEDHGVEVRDFEWEIIGGDAQ